MANEKEILLEVKNVCKYFPVKRRPGKFVKAVDDVSFFVRKGENLGIVGESGCGKSTLARTLIRLYEPTSGTIMLDGNDISGLTGKKLNAARGKMQMVFQDPYSSLDPRMTVYAILKEMLKVHKICPDAEIPEKIEALLSMTGLGRESASRYPGEFSGGQRQRICIARALSSHPEFIIADEPVSALDVSIQAQILNLLKKLQKELNLTVLFISHDLNVIRYISDRVIVMYLGSVVEEGRTEDVFLKPLHPYAEVLTKAVPELDPKVRSRESAIEGDLPSPIDLPEGCRFHPRCKYCQEKCRTERPLLAETDGGRRVACHYPLHYQESEEKENE
ncbi:MAG: ATP-binding cassette domain-containing protein [Eubacteriales bacterium]|nr:ATP-binding cassette domain-containing protein [Eubacteriales bacterium]